MDSHEWLNNYWWYVECPLCANVDVIHGKCNMALFKPDADKNGVCEYYKEL